MAAKVQKAVTYLPLEGRRGHIRLENLLAGSLTTNFSETEVGKGTIERMKTDPLGNRA